MDDKFLLFDLKVEIISSDKPMICNHKEGDYFLVIGEDLVFPANNSFSMYALSALLPFLPAKQRPLHANDWMLSDSVIACPDPNCGAKFKISRIGRREYSHAKCTAEPIYNTGHDQGHEQVYNTEHDQGHEQVYNTGHEQVYNTGHEQVYNTEHEPVIKGEE